ncbi:MAG: hypothetical protein GQ475_04155 [Methylococcaceae bacterium]|nr:hypothetical protein [Methylococcaceae bacterium]
MKRLLLTVITLILPFTFSISVKADIIDNGTYTTDTLSGLDWLDVTASINKSYNDVIDQFDANGEFSGYRYATANEFNTLISHYTGVIISQTQVRQVIDKPVNTDRLMDMLGSTQLPAKRRRGRDIEKNYTNEQWARMLDSVVGITINGQEDNGYVYISYSILAKTQDFGTKIWHYSNADINRYINRNKADVEVGSFLVRKSK